MHPLNYFVNKNSLLKQSKFLFYFPFFSIFTILWYILWVFFNIYKMTHQQKMNREDTVEKTQLIEIIDRHG